MLASIGGGDLLAQGPGPRIVPRGQVIAEASALLHRTETVYATGGALPLGRHFYLPAISSTTVPELAPLEADLQSLAGASPPALVLGGSLGHLSLSDDVVPLAIAYGLTNRITVGATLPIVRRRVGALLRYTPTGANVGRSPFETDAASVNGFLSLAGASLSQTSSAVDGYCAGAGEGDPQCVGGRSLVQSATDFLATLDDLYSNASPFALSGSDLGNAVAARWGGLAAGFTTWGAPDPGAAPLSTDPLPAGAFAQLILAPGWPPGGLPRATAPPFFSAGDLEIQGALRVLGPPPSDPREAPPAAADPGATLDLGITIRLATGAPDSLRALAPMGTGQGVPGLAFQVAGEWPAGETVSLGWRGEAGWHGSREAILLSPDPTRPFSDGHTRARVSWSPGGHLRLLLVPRVHLAPTLSAAASWELLHQGVDRFEALDTPSPTLPAGSARTAHTLGVEIRFHGLGSPAAETLRFPFESYLRFSGTVRGSDGTSVVRSVEGGIAIAIRR